MLVPAISDKSQRLSQLTHDTCGRHTPGNEAIQELNPAFYMAKNKAQSFG